MYILGTFVTRATFVISPLSMEKDIVPYIFVDTFTLCVRWGKYVYFFAPSFVHSSLMYHRYVFMKVISSTMQCIFQVVLRYWLVVLHDSSVSGVYFMNFLNIVFSLLSKHIFFPCSFLFLPFFFHLFSSPFFHFVNVFSSLRLFSISTWQFVLE